MSYSPGRGAFNPDPVTLQAEKEKYMMRIQENQQKDHDQQQTIKALTNEVEELNLKLSYLSIELAKREDECSRQTSTIQKLINQRDSLQDKVLQYEKQLSVSNNLDTALKNLGDSSLVEENKSLKLQLAAVQQEADIARQEILRMKAEFDLKEAGYKILEPQDQDHAPRAPHNRERAVAPISETQQNGTNHTDPGNYQQHAPTGEVKRESTKVEPPKPKKSALPDSPVLFELPSLKRFPVSRRDKHVLSTVREDGYLNPKFSPSLPHRPPDIAIAPNAVAPAASVATDATSAASSSSAAAPPDPAAVAEAQRRLDAALAAQREHRAAAPPAAAAPAAGQDQVRVVVHSGRHLPKMDTFGSIDGFVRLELRRDAAAADAPAAATFETKVIKNELNPDWGEAFEFKLNSEKALVLTLLDWERLGKPRAIGTVQVPLRWLRECRGQNGLFALKSPEGNPVTGKDGQPAALHLEMHYDAAPAPAAPVDPRAAQLEVAVDSARRALAQLTGAPPPPPLTPAAPAAPAAAPRAAAASGGVLPWRLKVCLQRAVNLPKMDLIGSADPYVNIQLGTQKFKSKTLKNTLDPVWDENFEFTVEDETADLFLTLMDWDRGSNDDVIGTVRIPVAQFLGQTHAGAFPVVKPGTTSKPVRGKNGDAQVDKVQKMVKSEAAAKTMQRFLRRNLINSFRKWNYVTEMELLQKDKESALAATQSKLDEKQDMIERLSNVTESQVKEQQALIEKLTSDFRDERMQLLTNTDQKTMDLLKKLSESEQLKEEEKRLLTEEAEQREAKAREEAKSHAEEIRKQQAALSNMLAEAKLARGGPFISVTVEEAANLPKVDTFGWIDPFVEISHGGLTQQTEIKKREENPKWNQCFRVPIAESSDEAAILFRLFDFELTSKPRPVGSVSILMDTIQAAGSLERAYPLQKEDGSALLGRGNSPSTLRLKLKYEAGDDNPEMAQLNAAIQEARQRIQAEKEASDRAEAEARALKDMREASFALPLPFNIRVVLNGARHMPKMDTLGSIDAYCVFTLGSQEFRSATCKNNYNPDWTGEAFNFHVSSRSQSLEIRIMDWDRTGKDELCGMIRIPVGRLKPGKVPVEEYLICGSDGQPVVGHDKQNSQVLLTIEATALPKEEGASDAAAAAQDFKPWMLEVVVEKAEHLPKMDTFGTCDGYCILSICGQRSNTQIRKNTYDPEWNQPFTFTITSATEELVVVLRDWDLNGDDEFVGVVHVSLDRIQRLSKERNEPQRVTFPILTKEGGKVVGHDKMASVLTLTLAPVAEEADQIVGATGVEAEPSQRGSLWVTAKGASGLPKMDFLSGKADPFIVFLADGAPVHKTAVKRGTLAPVWEERFEIRCTSGKTTIIAQMADYNSGGKDKVMGFFTIPVRSSYKGTSRTFPLTGSLENGAPACGDVTLLLNFVEGDGKEPDHSGDTAVVVPGGSMISFRVNVDAVNNLPKTDLMGACDPYVKLQVGAQTFQTTTKKNVFDVEFGQYFDFLTVSRNDTLKVTIYDWNKSSLDSEVGHVEIRLADIGEEKVQQSYELMGTKNQKVFGKNKQATCVHLGLTLLKAPNAAANSGSAETADAYEVTFEMKSCSHMPKMDTLGKCDPFFCIEMDDWNSVKTKTLMNCFGGEFNQTFKFKCNDYRGKIITVTGFDFDVGSKNDLIGTATIELSDLLDAEADYNSYILLDKDKQPIKGYDKQTACFDACVIVKKLEGAADKNSLTRQNTIKSSKPHVPADMDDTTKTAGVDIDNLISTLEELEIKETDFKAWVQVRSDKLVVLMEDVKKLQSEDACDKPRTVQDIAERIGYMMGTGFTAAQSEFMLGILATLLQLVLVKILLLGS